MKHTPIMPIVVFGMCLLLNGCSTGRLSMSEEADWGLLLSEHVVSEPIPFKSSGKAGTWDFIIPGTGSIYAGGGKCWGWLIGGIAAWPISPFYQPAIGITNAKNTNRRRTIEYYKFGAHQKNIDDLQKKNKLPANFKLANETTIFGAKP